MAAPPPPPARRALPGFVPRLPGAAPPSGPASPAPAPALTKQPSTGPPASPALVKQPSTGAPAPSPALVKQPSVGTAAPAPPSAAKVVGPRPVAVGGASAKFEPKPMSKFDIRPSVLPNAKGTTELNAAYEGREGKLLVWGERITSLTLLFQSMDRHEVGGGGGSWRGHCAWYVVGGSARVCA
jgi:hypothetical protein